MQEPKEESITPNKYVFCKSALTAKERYVLKGEQTGQVPPIHSAVCLQPHQETNVAQNLQTFRNQDVLQSQGRFNIEKPSPEQADGRTSPTWLHLVTQDG